MKALTAKLLAILVLLANANAANLGFTQTDYAGGGHPFQVLIGDFNADGKPDIVSASLTTSGSLLFPVLLGNGDGTFRKAKVTSVTADAFTGFCEGDFNGDGRLDLAYTRPTANSVWILLGNGDGTFQPPASYPVSGPAWQPVTADFNGDGKLDLAVSDFSANLVSVLLGNGDGTFQAAKDVAAYFPAQLAVGDFNHDGKLDIVAAGLQLEIDVLLGNGDGTFQSSTTLPAGNPAVVRVADFDSDGNPDIMYAEAGGHVEVALGNGDGTLQPEILSPGVGQFGDSYAVADFFDDGKLDLVGTGGFTTHVDLLFGMGNGHFHYAQRIGVTDLLSALTVTAGDLNGDGQADIVVSNRSGKITVLLNQGFQAH